MSNGKRRENASNDNYLRLVANLEDAESVGSISAPLSCPVWKSSLMRVMQNVPKKNLLAIIQWRLTSCSGC